MTRLDRLKKIASDMEYRLKNDDTLRNQHKIDLETKYNGILDDILDELNITDK